jgi:methylthioribose-1-phosphate isomerase
MTKEDLQSCSVHLSEDERAVIILDQTRLPNKKEYLTLT